MTALPTNPLPPVTNTLPAIGSPSRDTHATEQNEPGKNPARLLLILKLVKEVTLPRGPGLRCRLVPSAPHPRRPGRHDGLDLGGRRLRARPRLPGRPPHPRSICTSPRPACGLPN